jgi:nucleotide-binding universal stress UspA family protein
MTLRSVMFHLDDGDAPLRFAPPLLQFARDYQVRDLVAAAPGRLPDPFVAAAFPLAQAQAREREMYDLIESLQQALCEAADGFALDFRSAGVLDVTAFLLDQAARCDLIVTRQHRALDTDLGQADLSRLVLQAGRPVLAVPRSAETLRFRRVLIGYKRSREARLALSAGLPLMSRADRILVAALGEGTTAPQLADAVDFLKGHGLPAEGWQNTDIADADAAEGLLQIAEDDDSDLIVAGAYSRGRLREIVLGGVTHALLQQTGRACLLIH